MTGSILITGCSSGIGLDAARTLTSRGWTVIASCRNPDDTARLRAEGLNSVTLDYADPGSVESGLTEALDLTGGRLDALFNNGAYAIPCAVEDLPRDALKELFEANLFGWHDLTRRVIPVMRSQGSGRIVNCSSVLGLIPVKWRGAYVASKFALEGLTDVMRMELAEDTSIHVSLIEPGPIGTKFRANAAKAFERWIDWERSPRAAQYRDSLIPRLYSDRPDKLQLGPEAVTAKLISALETPRPKPRYYVTTPTYMAGAMRRVLSTRAMDRVLMRR
ncbi:SDR family NAD(P)-dependent oxidoreductase [Qingshengfaniella alkalisoli]|uniref:SDR family NAD(P)-dependent oxidoreductase n=1 Tax=Qingshengfaniella alkalisoli TaxID=2599296 RepID=A0A5B8J224_9RHOB|nr:SDR family NAD(P)-dependent oxidoreductase [Qingshengfaniella alkalisoli]QDY68280.1 SDR family NAD(P)-dependent oxidoreductase [Qingshengfaniella alkalisoli]